MIYHINHKNGVNVAQTRKLTYEATHMGDAFLSTDIDAPQPINWQMGDYITFRGEKFTLEVLPTAVRNARDLSRGDAVKYKSVRFQSAIMALLQDALMLDYVTDDNNIHYTSLPNFSFYCSDDMISVEQDGQMTRGSRGLWQLADRLKANLNRAYPTLYWKVIIEQDTLITKPQSISVSNQNIWNVLADTCDKLGVNFTAKAAQNDDGGDHPDTDPIDYSTVYTITLGAIVHEIDNEFRYGKEQGISQGNGLMKIERTSDENQQVITRLYAYGSTRNIPYRYYNNLPGISESMYLPNLMLPMFRQNGHIAYVDSQNIASLGVREGVKFFDGSDENVPDIYPSITGMTTQIVYDALSAEERERQNYKDPQQFPNYNQGALDEVFSATPVTYDGVIPEQQTAAPTFEFYIKNLGFDPNEQIISGEQAKVGFNSGMLAGRECNIRAITKMNNVDSPTTYKVICEVTEDKSINEYFPNIRYNVAAGDKFILIGIRMPDIYVQAAEVRLQAAAEAFLAANDHTQYNYKLTIDNIYMARHSAIAEQLMAGTKLHIYDQSLGIDEHQTISNIKITVGENAIPVYDITLADKIEPTLIQRTTSEIEVKMQQQADEITTANTNRIIDAINDLRNIYISKLGTDRAKGPVSFTNGIYGGQSGSDAYTRMTDSEVMVCKAEQIVIRPTDVEYEDVTTTAIANKRYTRTVQFSGRLDVQVASTMKAIIGIIPQSLSSSINISSSTVRITNDTEHRLIDEMTDIEFNELGAATIEATVQPGNNKYTITFTASFKSSETQRLTQFINNVRVDQSSLLPNTGMKMTKDGIFRLGANNTWTQVL